MALAEFFGFEPDKLVDDVFNSVAEYIDTGVDSVKDAATQEFGLSGGSRKGKGAARSELKEGCETLKETLREGIFYKNLELFELYVMKNLFVLPAAAEDEAAEDDGAALPDGEALAAQVAELSDAIAAARKRHRTLARAKAELAAQLPALRADAERLVGVVAAVTQPSTAAAGGGSDAGVAPSLADLAAQAAKVHQVSKALSEGGSGSSGRGARTRASFGGVMSQFQRDKKAMGGK